MCMCMCMCMCICMCTFHGVDDVVAPTSENLFPVYFQAQQQYLMVYGQACPLNFLENEVDQWLYKKYKEEGGASARVTARVGYETK